MTKRVTIEIPEEIRELMEAEAARGGRQPDAYVLDLIVKRLEDLHDIALAETELERVRSGESRTYSLADVKAEFGLDD